MYSLNVYIFIIYIYNSLHVITLQVFINMYTFIDVRNHLLHVTHAIEKKIYIYI